jgi:homoserine kinase type II
MSVFTTVTADELSAWLERYPVGTLVSHEGIAAGIENTNYFVTTSQGRFVLTLFEKLRAEELPFYLGLMDHLADRGVPSAKPVRDQSGGFLGRLKGKPAALVRFLSGSDLTEPAADHCALVGAVLADIHRAGSSYENKMINPRGPRWWKSVMPEILSFLGPEDTALLTEEVRFQSLYRFEDLPQGAIHADLFRDNVLWENGHISGVIDFYFACTDRLLYDVAIAINDWCVEPGGTLDHSRTHALLEAYRRIRPFTAIERGAWPVMLRAAALRFWVSRLYDFYLPRPGELTHAKDPHHFRRILSSHVARERDLPQLGVPL